MLCGAHFMIMRTDKDEHSIILRFNEFLGPISAAFITDFGLKEQSSQVTDKLSINVLTDICMPLMAPINNLSS